MRMCVKPQPGDGDIYPEHDDVGSMSRCYVCRHLAGTASQLHVPKTFYFPFPLKYVNVARQTYRDVTDIGKK